MTGTAESIKALAMEFTEQAGKLNEIAKKLMVQACQAEKTATHLYQTLEILAPPLACENKKPETEPKEEQEAKAKPINRLEKIILQTVDRTKGCSVGFICETLSDKGITSKRSVWNACRKLTKNGLIDRVSRGHYGPIIPV